MNVLVWQSYGTVRVFHAETPMHFFKIYHHLKTEMQGWGEDKALSHLFDDMGNAPSLVIARREVESFIRKHIASHEAFEIFEFVKMVEPQ